jgi:hypothetical protein
MNIRICDGLVYLAMYVHTAISSDDRATVLPSLYHSYELHREVNTKEGNGMPEMKGN